MALTTPISRRKHRKANKVTCYRPTGTRAGSSSGAFTARWSRGSTRPGGPARLSYSPDCLKQLDCFTDGPSGPFSSGSQCWFVMSGLHLIEYLQFDGLCNQLQRIVRALTQVSTWVWHLHCIGTSITSNWQSSATEKSILSVSSIPIPSRRSNCSPAIVKAPSMTKKYAPLPGRLME